MSLHYSGPNHNPPKVYSSSSNTVFANIFCSLVHFIAYTSNQFVTGWKPTSLHHSGTKYKILQ